MVRTVSTSRHTLIYIEVSISLSEYLSSAEIMTIFYNDDQDKWKRVRSLTLPHGLSGPRAVSLSYSPNPEDINTKKYKLFLTGQS